MIAQRSCKLLFGYGINSTQDLVCNRGPLTGYLEGRGDDDLSTDESTDVMITLDNEQSGKLSNTEKGSQAQKAWAKTHGKELRLWSSL